VLRKLFYLKVYKLWKGPCHSLGGLFAGFTPLRPKFEPKSGHVGFVVDKTALWQVFCDYLGFPCQSFHRLLHTHHHPSSGAGTIRQIVANVPSGLNSCWGWRFGSTIHDCGTRYKWTVSFAPRRLYSRGNSPLTNWIWGCVDPRVCLDAAEKIKRFPFPGIELRPSSP
jgi:hypothetical protein